MGCCILGAILFGLLLRFWHRLRGMLGLPARAQPTEPSAWRLGQPIVVAPTLARPQRPLVSRRMAAAVMLVPVLGYAAYSAPAHAAHIKAELAYALNTIGLPVSTVIALCHGR